MGDEDRLQLENHELRRLLDELRHKLDLAVAEARGTEGGTHARNAAFVRVLNVDLTPERRRVRRLDEAIWLNYVVMVRHSGGHHVLSTPRLAGEGYTVEPGTEFEVPMKPEEAQDVLARAFGLAATTVRDSLLRSRAEARLQNPQEIPLPSA